MSETIKPPPGHVGPWTHPETGEHFHFGPHSTQVVLAGGAVVRLAHGESVVPPKDGEPAVVFRVRKES